jgi:hypothetical protein
MFGHPIPVRGIERKVMCKLATRPAEWDNALRLVAENYKARGYEPAHYPEIRFTPYHALPETVTLVAKAEDEVVATLSLVFDNLLLGLPMESIYGPEINGLRRQGRRLVEVTSLADRGFSVREFLPIFVTLMHLLTQYGFLKGADTWVISVNPRHRNYYRKAMGFASLGPWRSYPSVQNHPAEAYYLDESLLKAHSAEMYKRIVEETLPRKVLAARPMPFGLLQYFASRANQADRQLIEEVLNAVEAGELV